MSLSSLVIFVLISGVIVFVIYNLLLRYNNLRSKVHETIKEKAILKILVPIRNDKKALAAEQLFQSLHGILKNDESSLNHYSFEILGASHGIYFIVVCPLLYKNFVENQIYAQFPEAQINLIHDYAKVLPEQIVQSVELKYSKEFFLPIRTFPSFEVDPLAAITGAIAGLKGDSEVWVQVLSRPINSNWQDLTRSYVQKLKGLESTKEIAAVSDIEKKASKPGFQFSVRIISKGSNKIEVEQNLEDVIASFKQFQTANQNSLIRPKKKKKNPFVEFRKKISLIVYGKRLKEKLSILEQYKQRFLDEREKNILNVEELASIYHFPNESVKTPNIAWAKSRKLEYPLNLPFYNEKVSAKENPRVFAFTDYRNVHVPFGISKEDRRRHMYLVGKTGSGKSSFFLKSMIIGDIINGEGVCVLDPHGDLVEEILDYIPENRLKDVIYLDPSDIENPIGLNMLDIQEDETKDLLADGIVSVFKKFFGDSWGPRLQYILTNVILTLLNCQNVSLLAVQRILTDKNYRKFLLKQIRDPFILKFWEDEFAQLSQNVKLLAEAVSPIQNKVGRFLSSPMVRNMIGQIKSNINLREIMNEGKIFLVNLSQGKIGEENSSLLGGMIVTRLYTNAMQRASLDKEKRKDFYLYVDEFQNFATDTFMKILSEARKYGLDLIVTHQYIDQISPEIQDAIFGNIGTLMNFVVGQKDADRLAREYTPFLASEDLVNLDKFRMVLKMTIDGAQSLPFTAIAMQPPYKAFNLKEKVKLASRENFSSSREIVEQKLNKWANQDYDDKGNLKK